MGVSEFLLWLIVASHVLLPSSFGNDDVHPRSLGKEWNAATPKSTENATGSASTGAYPTPRPLPARRFDPNKNTIETTIWVFPKIGVRQNGWWIFMENLINPWMIWVENPTIFRKQHPYRNLEVKSLSLKSPTGKRVYFSQGHRFFESNPHRTHVLHGICTYI